MAPPVSSKTRQFQYQAGMDSMAMSRPGLVHPPHKRNEPSASEPAYSLHIQDFRESWEERTKQYAAQLRDQRHREYNLDSIATPINAWGRARPSSVMNYDNSSYQIGVSTNDSGAKSSKTAASTSKSAVSHSKLHALASKSVASPRKTHLSTRLAGSGKMIVNKFHASNLSIPPLFSLKEKPTSVVATSAVAAYETSVHAAKYLPQEPSTFEARNVLHKSYFNDLAMDTEPRVEETNDGSETDSLSGQYVVQSLYLNDKEEQEHTQQSLDIRLLPTPDVPDMPEESDDDGTSEYYTPKCILSPSLFPCVPPYLNFSSHAKKGPAMPLALHNVLKWKLSPVMPNIVKRVVLNSGFRIIKQTTEWMAVWEKHMTPTGFHTIRSHQKYNHLPGTFCIGRKDSLWRSVREYIRNFGVKEFGIMQKTYILPEDMKQFRKVWARSVAKKPTWICKPPASARGTGIRIINRWSHLPKDRALVVQRYIERPLLINDNKFDMRLYVLITSVNPLRIFMYKDGLARFASVKYSSARTSLNDRCMHLTNYSINKYSEYYSRNEDFNACQGHKWTLQSLWCCLENRGVNTKRLWATLRNLVIKAVISGEPNLTRMYRQHVNFRYNCFELFGFDVLLDENLVPWLLEVNISPSLHSELPLDLHVKGPLVQAVLNTALFQVPPKLTAEQQQEILKELKLDCDQLCLDKRIFTMCLLNTEVQKHSMYSRMAEERKGYLEEILHNLTPDDVRCLIIAEDELARSEPLERIFPTADTHEYLKFLNCYSYYNRLMDAWEHKYAVHREQGRDLLRTMTENLYHQNVPPEAEEKEPHVKLTYIDLLRVKCNEPNSETSAQVPIPLTDDDDL